MLTLVTESGWTALQRARRPSKIKRHLAEHDRVRLMIGSGPSKVDGWLATDVLPSRSDVVLLDAGRRFPFADASVDRIHTEHMIEHVDRGIGQRMLAECHRVLKPGGRIRIATPDFARVVAVVGHDDAELAELVRQSNLRRGVDPAEAHDPVYAVNRLFSGHGHRFLYTEDMLRRALEAVGLRDVTRCEVGQSDDADLQDAEQHDRQIDPAWNRYQTMVLEATKAEMG